MWYGITVPSKRIWTALELPILLTFRILHVGLYLMRLWVMVSGESSTGTLKIIPVAVRDGAATLVATSKVWPLIFRCLIEDIVSTLSSEGVLNTK